MALIVFAKLLEVGLSTKAPVAYDAVGNVAQAGSSALLLLMEDKSYATFEQLPPYDLTPNPVMVIRHKVGDTENGHLMSNGQLEMVNRHLEGKGQPCAIPMPQTFSHIPADQIFVNLRNLVLSSGALERQSHLSSLERRFAVDHYTQVMDKYAALKFLYDLCLDDDLRAETMKALDEIPEQWRQESTLVEEWYKNLIDDLSSTAA